jgi:alanyl-tRNA synthetase
MQPLVPYLLGQPHPEGNRLVDSQTCFRAEDMDEVGDNRHTTFFEMLGNWSLGDYFKKEQLPWFWEFLTEVLKLPRDRLWVTCFEGDETTGVPKDTESAEIWKSLGVPEDRIRFYGAEHNWWSREGVPANMRDGEPGGPDSEVFYEFTQVEHDKKFGEQCHPNCDCGRFLEIGNSVFMTYRKNGDKFVPLPKPNVDFGGGLERIAAAVIDSPDVFQISLLKPIVSGLEELSGKSYGQYQNSMRVIADHLRAGVFLAVDGVAPSNKQQGYVMRRLLRRAIRYAFDLGIEQDLCEKIAPTVINLYKNDFPEVAEREKEVIDVFMKEEKIFRQTLRAGVREFQKMSKDEEYLTSQVIFKLYDTYGFPMELSLEEAYRQNVKVEDGWRVGFDKLMNEQRQRSQTASAGMFKGGLADHSPEVVKLHTTTHLMYQALKNILGDHVVQRGSNITAERTRFDFSHPEKVTREQLDEVEKIVNEQIEKDLPVTWKEEKTDEAFAKCATRPLCDKLGVTLKV